MLKTKSFFYFEDMASGELAVVEPDTDPELEPVFDALCPVTPPPSELPAAPPAVDPVSAYIVVENYALTTFSIRFPFRSLN